MDLNSTRVVRSSRSRLQLRENGCVARPLVQAAASACIPWALCPGHAGTTSSIKPGRHVALTDPSLFSITPHHHQPKHLPNQHTLVQQPKTNTVPTKMQPKTILATLAAAAPLASAAGSARVINHCPYPVTLWSVGSSVSAPSTLAAGTGSYSEPFRRDPVTGGIAIKITTAPDGLYTGAPQLNYAYSLDGAQVWYDLSTVFGVAFPGKKLVVASAETSCPAITWTTGSSPGGSQVKTCTSGKDVALILCAEGEW